MMHWLHTLIGQANTTTGPHARLEALTAQRPTKAGVTGHTASEEVEGGITPLGGGGVDGGAHPHIFGKSETMLR